MAATWPSGVPATPQREGYGIRRAENVKRSQTDSGKPKQRPRYTAAPRYLPVSFRWTPEEWNTFETWMQGTLARGTLPFEFTEHVTGKDYTATIVGGDSGVEWQLGPGAYLTVTMTLELI